MEDIPDPERLRAKEALGFIISVLEKYGFKWLLTGGFAVYAYGVKRPITDIDIDIDTNKDDPKFLQFMEEVKPKMTQELIHFVDQNYDNYNFEITVNGIVIDICPMKEMNVFDKDAGRYIHFYQDGMPAHEVVDFEGLKLPLLSKDLIIKNKEMVPFQRDSDQKDIVALKSL